MSWLAGIGVIESGQAACWQRRFDLRCTCCSPFDLKKIESIHVLVVQRIGQILRQQVGYIVSAGHLMQAEVLRPQPILHPKVGDSQVAYAAKPASPTYANGCRRVREDAKLYLQVKILAQSLKAETFSRGVTDPCEFGLSRTQRHSALSFGPALYNVAAKPGHSSGR